MNKRNIETHISESTEILLTALKQRLSELETLITISNNNVKQLKSIPDDHIITSNCKKWPQFYRIESNSKHKSYIPSLEIPLIQKSLQKDYELRVNRALLADYKKTLSLINFYSKDSITSTYSNLGTGKRALITPIIPTDAAYIKEWLQSHPGSQNNYPQEISYETLAGELVRSKSEKIIADCLYQANVPYRYEPQLRLSSGHYIYPDFIALNVRKRTAYYWEHLGLVSDDAYASKNLNKISIYEKEGIWIGEKLIISQESTGNPLDVNLIKEKIQKYLL